MRKRNSWIQAGAICGAAALVPTVAHAAVATFVYDSAQIATNSAFSTGVQTVPIVGNTLTVPQGDFFRFGMAVTVTGTDQVNPAAALPYSTDVQAQPATLGLTAFGLSLADSNNTIATPVIASGGLTTAKLNSQLDSVGDKGVPDASGNIGIDSPANAIAAGYLINASTFDPSDPTQLTHIEVGSTTPNDNVFTVLAYSTGSAGTVTLSGNITNNTVSFANYVSGGTDDNTPPVYANRNFTTGEDSIVGPGNLTVVVTPVPEPASLGLLGVGAFGLLTRRRSATAML